jgi:hypothetical protein
VKLPIVRVIPNDDPHAKELLASNVERNGFEERMLDYPSLRLLQAEKEGKRLGVLPIHPVLMLDSMATEDVGIVDKGRAMAEMVKVACTEALRNGIQEVYLVDSDAVTTEAAKGIGFKRLQSDVYCLRLPLEKELK